MMGTQAFWTDIGWGSVAWVVVSVIVASLGKERLRQQGRGEVLIFRSALTGSISAYMLALLFAVVPPLLLIDMLHKNIGQPPPTPLAFVSAAALEAMVAGIILLLLWGGGAVTMEIDVAARTYRYTRGWLFGTQTDSGSLDELAGISLSGEASTSIMLRLKYRKGWFVGYTIGSYRSRKKAEEALSEIAEAVGLPVIPSLWG